MLFSMLLNDNIEDIEETNGTCLPTFFVDEFSKVLTYINLFY